MKPLMIAIPVIVVGAVVGLAMTGKINIPGITKTPPKGYVEAPKDGIPATQAQTVSKTQHEPLVKKESSAPKAKPDSKAAKKDIEQGADALATVWNGIKTPELIAISRNWKDQDLVRVLTHMDNDKVSEFLEQMAKGDEQSTPKVKADPLRASKLSRILQDQGSIVKPVGANQTT